MVSFQVPLAYRPFRRASSLGLPVSPFPQERGDHLTQEYEGRPVPSTRDKSPESTRCAESYSPGGESDALERLPEQDPRPPEGND